MVSIIRPGRLRHPELENLCFLDFYVLSNQIYSGRNEKCEGGNLPPWLYTLG
jgi:hypothetical protein